MVPADLRCDETIDGSPEPVRVLVVDDHRAFADLLSRALSEVGMRPIGTAHSAAQALAVARDSQPDLVLMDIQMPGQDGLTATRWIREVAPGAIVVALTAHREPDFVIRAAQAGVSGYISKNGSLAELLDVLSRVRSGQMLVAPSTFGNPRPDEDAAGHPPRDAVPELSPREHDVLGYLSQGMQVKAIARVLTITEETCRGYVKSLHSKLGARTQLQVLVNAQRLGLLAAPNGS